MTKELSLALADFDEDDGGAGVLAGGKKFFRRGAGVVDDALEQFAKFIHPEVFK